MSMDREGAYGGDMDERPQRRTLLTPAVVATVVIVAVIVIFVLQNRERTQIDFLFVELNSRVWVALAIAVGLGVLLDRVIQFWWRRRRSRRDDR
jgi:uncharacterized integral membrane protein